MLSPGSSKSVVLRSHGRLVSSGVPLAVPDPRSSPAPAADVFGRNRTMLEGKTSAKRTQPNKHPDRRSRRRWRCRRRVPQPREQSRGIARPLVCVLHAMCLCVCVCVCNPASVVVARCCECRGVAFFFCERRTIVLNKNNWNLFARYPMRLFLSREAFSLSLSL